MAPLTTGTYGKAPAMDTQDKAVQDKAAQDPAGHAGVAGQQPGQDNPVQPAAGDVRARQEAVTTGAPDGPYDEIAATDQAHAHAEPGTIEHEQAKAMAEADPETLLDPRERNQLTEARTMKEKAQDLLKDQEQQAKDDDGKTADGKTADGKSGDSQQ